MSWSTSGDVRRFAGEAGEFLRARPVEHTTLLTETAYFEARRGSEDQLYGWWRDAGGNVAGAFLQAPRHAPVLSPMPAEAVESLADLLRDVEAVEAPGELADTVAAAWQSRQLTERSRITLHRWEGLVPDDRPPGRARIALDSDRELLLDWYHEMMARYPEDPTEAEYVVDDPISFGGITLWEVDGEPVAMAGRSRLVAGMVRLSAVFAVGGDETLAEAAFAAAARAAGEIAEHVLVFAPVGKVVAGFRPVLDRVTLQAN